jgi:hypothetical protein
VQRPRGLRSILSACSERPGDVRIGAEFLEPEHEPAGPSPVSLARHFPQGRPRDGYHRDGKAAAIPSIELCGDVEHASCDQRRRARQVGKLAAFHVAERALEAFVSRARTQRRRPIRAACEPADRVFNALPVAVVERVVPGQPQCPGGGSMSR